MPIDGHLTLILWLYLSYSAWLCVVFGRNLNCLILLLISYLNVPQLISFNEWMKAVYFVNLIMQLVFLNDSLEQTDTLRSGLSTLKTIKQKQEEWKRKLEKCREEREENNESKVCGVTFIHWIYLFFKISLCTVKNEISIYLCFSDRICHWNTNKYLLCWNTEFLVLLKISKEKLK